MRALYTRESARTNGGRAQPGAESIPDDMVRIIVHCCARTAYNRSLVPSRTRPARLC